jgi:hypothetical protein
MNRILQVAFAALLACSFPVHAAAEGTSAGRALNEPASKPSAPSGNEDVYSVYAPWVVLGVIAVGGLIAGLAASNSGRS